MSHQQSFSYKEGWVFLCRTSTKLGSMCLAQGHNAATPMRLEPVAPGSRVRHSTTEPLRSLIIELEEDIMVLSNVTKFHKIWIKTIRLRESVVMAVA